jgi:RNA polymerase sigma-70 factor (ECF subfamily)
VTREAYHRLYDALSARALGFFVRRTPDSETAVDLWAETFAVAYEKRRSFRGAGDEQAEAWLFGIAYRQLARYRRRGAIEQRALRRLGLERPTITDDDLERVLELGAGDAVRGALAGLPPDHAAAVRLRIVDELPYEEVARRLGITQDNARARVSRGLRTLATTMEQVND